MRNKILGKYAELTEEELQQLEQEFMNKYVYDEPVAEVDPKQLEQLLNSFKEE